MNTKFDIIFEMKPLDQIACFRGESGPTIHLYALSDSYWYYDLGETHLLEYQESFLKKYGIHSPYNDYYLERLSEDLIDSLPFIHDSISEEMYCFLKDSGPFVHDTFCNAYAAFIPEEERELTAEEKELESLFEAISDYLFYVRHLDHGYLIGGPLLYFFRCKDRLLIQWKILHPDIWTASSGWMEMDYHFFLQSIKQFEERYFSSLTFQMEQALKKDWGIIYADKSSWSKQLPMLQARVNQTFQLLDHYPYSAEYQQAKILYENLSLWKYKFFIS